MCSSSAPKDTTGWPEEVMPGYIRSQLPSLLKGGAKYKELLVSNIIT